MIERIRQLYKIPEQRLLPVPWCNDTSFSLNEIFTELRIVGKDKTTGEMKDDITNMTGIYKTHEECKEPPRIVLIEGDPGTGKTTYCQKLAYDWATSREHWDESFPTIALLLLLRCHDIKSNLREAIYEQLLPDVNDEKCKENLFKFICDNQSRVLFVLDGLNEVADHGAIDMFINLAQSKELSKCLFVFTSRHEFGMKMRCYCDNLWEIVGFREEDAKHFIYNYFGNRKHLADTLRKEISSRSDLRQLITNPLNTALLCILCEDSITAFPESRSQLYIEIVKCILRRYEEKEGISSNNEDIIEVYREELRSLGRIALQSLLKGELYIEESKVKANNFESVSKLGFLSIQSRGSKGKPFFRYGFLHKSFQEFFAGFHLALNNPKEEDEAKIKITDQRFLCELHQVFLYICGVVAMQSEENAKRLLREITDAVNMLRANFKEVVGNMKLAFLLIEECGKCKKSLHSQLLHEFGVHLKLKACTSGMIPRLDFFLESLSSNTVLTDLDLHLSFLRTKFSRAKIDNREIALLYQALSVNTTLTHLNLSNNKIGASGARSLSVALSGYTTKLTHLNLSNNKIDASGAKSLSEALSVNTALTHLNLDGNLLRDHGAARLSVALSFNTTLTHLNLHGNSIGDFGAAHLFQALSRNTTLTDLNLGSNEIGDSDADSLFQALLDNTTLTHLNLSNNKIDDSRAAFLFEVVSENTTLTDLNLSSNEIGVFDTSFFFRALSSNTTLTHLNLSGNIIGDSNADSLFWALSKNDTLTHLDLSDNYFVGFFKFMACESPLQNTTLTHLNLSNNKINAYELHVYFPLLHHGALIHWNLSNNKIDANGAVLLFQVLSDNATLTDLNLSSNEISASDAASLSEVLPFNTTLTHLNLSNNKIDASGDAFLFQVLSKNTSLTDLNLSGNGIGASDAASFYRALSVNTTLTHLNLSGNGIGASDVASFYRALSVNTSLTHLNLSGNGIGASDAASFYRALSVNTTLTHLNLSGDNIGDSDALSLFEALSKNTTLTYLNLSDNNIGDSGAASLSQALSANTLLTHLNLSKNRIGALGAASLCQVLSVNSSLTYLDLHFNKIGDLVLLLSLRPFQSILY